MGGVIAAVAAATLIGNGAFFFKGCLCERENHLHIYTIFISRHNLHIHYSQARNYCKREEMGEGEGRGRGGGGEGSGGGGEGKRRGGGGKERAGEGRGGEGEKRGGEGEGKAGEQNYFWVVMRTTKPTLMECRLGVGA